MALLALDQNRYRVIAGAALEALFPKHVLLASFGDSAFDVELLRAARVGVAVRPKPALAARLEELESIATLEWADGEDTRSA